MSLVSSQTLWGTPQFPEPQVALQQTARELRSRLLDLPSHSQRLPRCLHQVTLPVAACSPTWSMSWSALGTAGCACRCHRLEGVETDFPVMCTCAALTSILSNASWSLDVPPFAHFAQDWVFFLSLLMIKSCAPVLERCFLGTTHICSHPGAGHVTVCQDGRAGPREHGLNHKLKMGSFPTITQPEGPAPHMAV